MPSPTILTGLIVGAVLGFILQRGRFCITGAFRDLWVSRSWRWFTAFLLAIAVQAVGVAVLTSAGSITPEIPKLSVVATVVGSFLFGVGIVLAGGCATGTYYRAGEGLVGSFRIEENLVLNQYDTPRFSRGPWLRRRAIRRLRIRT